MATTIAANTTGGDDFEPGELVRVFSMSIKAKYEHDSDNESEIERALVEDFDNGERRRKKRLREIEEYLESTRPQELMELNRKRQALELAVRDFCASAAQKNHPEDLSPKLESWQDVTAIVERMRERLERKQEKGKFRRATRHLRTFCNTVSAHSTALKMLPSNNEYVSVFYGALATSIQASESYTKVMESLPQALIDINDAVSAIEKRLWLFDNDAMKSYAWRMYSQIFAFLGDVIRWYTKRSFQRLVSSFNEHLPEFFEDQVEEIRKSAQLIHQEAHLRAHADAQMSRIYLEGLDEKFDRYMLELRERDRRNRNVTDRRYDQFSDMMNEVRRKELWEKSALQTVLNEIWTKLGRGETGSAVAEILEGDAQRQIEEFGHEQRLLLQSDDDQVTIGRQSPRPRSSRSSIQSVESLTSEGTRDAVLSFSATMESFFNRDRIQPDHEQPAGFFADSNMVARIQSWATAATSQVLYIAGDDVLSDNNAASSAAAQYAALAREAGLPVCSYFCRLANDAPPKGRTRETMELVALTYSMIRQLVELLPPKIPDQSTHLSKARFADLEGTFDSFRQALDILDYLLSSNGHAITILVIDGIDLLDDLTYQSSELWLKRLVDVLTKHTSRKQEGITKLLFTSEGRSTPLFEVLDPGHILLTSAPRVKKGRRQTGLMPLII
ncbi:hypothetical protein BDV95DRAFT_43142 [Massariosphaeria phaeospora]|uniref:DUF7708 domain-containing protein n=1 Tax=Massariosphaeria phaeospora TaxID=100035 RepID=A0A7C8I9L2_9PLEO|nr:hypothetical protein BDV95DRAFT_43142 [Massariosphaeria phaeospora]